MDLTKLIFSVELAETATLQRIYKTPLWQNEKLAFELFSKLHSGERVYLFYYKSECVGGVRLSSTGRVTIEYVVVPEKYRGNGICGYIVKKTVQEDGLGQTYELHNAGGVASCRCYARAFLELGFSCFITSEDWEPRSSDWIPIPATEILTKSCKKGGNDLVRKMKFVPPLTGLSSIHRM